MTHETRRLSREFEPDRLGLPGELAVGQGELASERGNRPGITFRQYNGWYSGVRSNFTVSVVLLAPSCGLTGSISPVGVSSILARPSCAARLGHPRSSVTGLYLKKFL